MCSSQLLKRPVKCTYGTRMTHLWYTSIIFFFGLCPSSNFWWSTTFQKPAVLPSSGKESTYPGGPLDTNLTELLDLRGSQSTRSLPFSGRESTCSVGPFRVGAFSPEKASKSGFGNVMFHKKLEEVHCSPPPQKKKIMLVTQYTIVGTLMIVLFNAITCCYSLLRVSALYGS